jgi:hypothetical protein
MRPISILRPQLSPKDVYSKVLTRVLVGRNVPTTADSIHIMWTAVTDEMEPLTLNHFVLLSPLIPSTCPRDFTERIHQLTSTPKHKTWIFANTVPDISLSTIAGKPAIIGYCIQ